MTFLDLAKKRYSTRNYKNIPVENEKLQLLLEAARIAPSAANYQPWRIIVVQQEANRMLLAQTYPREWFKQAPLVLVICAEKSKAWVRSFDSKNHADIDIAIATDHITLQATELGLGTCWICHFDAKKCAELLNLPNDIEPLVLLSVGYPADEPKPNRHETQRLPLSQIVSWESFGNDNNNVI